MIYLYIGLAGALGAISRYLVGIFFFSNSPFPFATLLINLVGCYALAYLTSRFFCLSSQLKTVVGTGFLGSFTTFSALSVETVELFEQGKVFLAFLYIVVSIVGGIFLSNLGWKKEVTE
ncbi:fluoride efflux transporter CrcB [Psychrobacillus sp. OK032]|uniref:fluoride efflux transporter CrcB n=1 Tax=Psychrobacillus sp. OK032 TaxID=1884358 RepID=UPI0008B73E7D|nr:fluoride efflux transporter CrcB [Psychrobacillus sp. OK032]SER90933.1 camphor resistance protein CrcB [Psychrobacillus sp. OK032]